MIATRNARPVFTIVAERGAQGPVVPVGGPARGPDRRAGRWSSSADRRGVLVGGPAGGPDRRTGMCVWPTAAAQRLYSASVLTLPGRPLVDRRPGLVLCAVMHGSIVSRRHTVVQQGPPPPGSGRLPASGRPPRGWSDGDYADDDEEYPPWAVPGAGPRPAGRPQRDRRRLRDRPGP